MNDDNKIQLARRAEAWWARNLAPPRAARLVDDLLDVADMRGEEHPATLGCLLALVREAWAGWVIALALAESGVSLRVTDINGVGSRRFDGDTLAEALVAALEAAP